MPWYYCYADFGPGHQSSGEHIVWQPFPLRRDDKEELFHSLFGEYDYPIGDIKLTKTLTEKEKKEMVLQYRDAIKHAKERIKHANNMFKIIENTPIQKSPRPRQAKAERRRRKTKQLLEEAQKRNREAAAKVKR